MPLRSLPAVGFAIWVAVSSSAQAKDDNRKDSQFSKRVAAVLQRRCFTCHNAKEHKGDFSLETWEEIESSGYIVPGDVESSYLLEVISPQEGKRAIMPKDSDPLSEAEVAAIRQWIADGAAWPAGYKLQEARVTDFDWWSWKPLERPQPPQIGEAEGATWVRTPIDAFILARLREKGLSPSPEADRRTLIRRLSFDLTGLPPAPAEVEQFVNDPDPLAYEKLMDRLLDSPRYGERWARHWLDVVHYGDTHGYDKDQPRPNAWPYRDYVIRAFNEDKPYGRFVQEQLAGDVLWPHTVDGVTATGFIAAGPWDFIGHVEAPESKYDGKVARNLDRDDMVANAMNTFCSLTIQCARCHHHKLDAVTMQDYYRLQAVFAAIDRADRPFDADPETARRRSELVQRKATLEKEATALRQEIESKKTPELAGLDESIAALEKQLSAPAGSSPTNGYHSQFAAQADTVKWVQVDLGRSMPLERVRLIPAFPTDFPDTPGFGFPVRFRLEAAEDAAFASPRVIVERTQADYPNPGNAEATFEAMGIEGRYVRLTATRLWDRGQNHHALAFAEMIVESSGGNAARNAAVTASDSIDAGRWHAKNLVDGFTSRAPLLAASETQTTLAGAASPQKQLEELVERRKVLEIEVIGAELAATRTQLQSAIKEVEGEHSSLPPPQRVYAGTVHNGSGNFRGRHGLGPREIHVLLRGDVNKPGELVQPGAVPLVPGIPAEFNLPSDADEGDRRAALAHWITHRDNPLTWRSIVNRVWLYHFGRGLVDTPNDFGRGGQLPTHPELLDWLAVEFRDGGQSMKALHRLICTSAAYRQTSDVESNGSYGSYASHKSRGSSVDSENRLLWRMDRRRLTAEEIRDATLAVAGKLDLTMGGPGFQDFVVEHPEHSPHYQYHLYDPDDPRTHRRAVYRFLVRSQPQPFMDTLDCADPSTSVPKREETLTSLQALAMLNNRFMIAMAQHLADRLEKEQPALPDQLAHGFRLTTSREPTAEELEELTTYAREFGLLNTCRVLLNLNEFVFVD